MKVCSYHKLITYKSILINAICSSMSMNEFILTLYKRYQSENYTKYDEYGKLLLKQNLYVTIWWGVNNISYAIKVIGTFAFEEHEYMTDQ